jgi:hypothetical protein
MLILPAAVAEVPVESTTFAFNWAEELVVGIPVMAPVDGFRVRPAGKDLIENV